jgi:hypothetical protein
MGIKKWSDSEVNILKNYAFAPMRELMNLLPGRKRNTIYWKLGVLGYNRETYRRYTKEEDDFIKNNCAVYGNRWIARELRRTEKSIAKRMIVLGIKRSEDELFAMKSKNAGCFKKGVKSSKTFAEGSLQLCFDEKNGSSFYNIKIGNKFFRFSRYLYEQYNNEVLKSTDIIFHKDGNAMNLLKENLIKVNRIELMRKNIDTDDAFIKRILRITDPDIIEKIKREMPWLIELKRQAIKLNQQLNKHE